MISCLLKGEPVDEKWMIAQNTILIMLHIADIAAWWGEGAVVIRTLKG